MGGRTGLRNPVSHTDQPELHLQLHPHWPERNTAVARAHLVAKIKHLRPHHHPPQAERVLPVRETLQGSPYNVRWAIRTLYMKEFSFCPSSMEKTVSANCVKMTETCAMNLAPDTYTIWFIWSSLYLLLLYIGEWFNADPEAVIAEALQTGGAPNVSDAYTINGLPGPLYNCSSKGTTQCICVSQAFVAKNCLITYGIIP